MISSVKKSSRKLQNFNFSQRFHSISLLPNAISFPIEPTFRTCVQTVRESHTKRRARVIVTSNHNNPRALTFSLICAHTGEFRKKVSFHLCIKELLVENPLCRWWKPLFWQLSHHPSWRMRIVDTRKFVRVFLVLRPFLKRSRDLRFFFFWPARLFAWRIEDSPRSLACSWHALSPAYWPFHMNGSSKCEK